jgi:hypothetical protein
MQKSLLVFITQVEYPAGGSYFLTATSRMIENKEELESFVAGIVSEQNKDGYKIVNSIMYTVPERFYKDATK